MVSFLLSKASSNTIITAFECPVSKPLPFTVMSPFVRFVPVTPLIWDAGIGSEKPKPLWKDAPIWRTNMLYSNAVTWPEAFVIDL